MALRVDQIPWWAWSFLPVGQAVPHTPSGVLSGRYLKAFSRAALSARSFRSSPHSLATFLLPRPNHTIISFGTASARIRTE